MRPRPNGQGLSRVIYRMYPTCEHSLPESGALSIIPFYVDSPVVEPNASQGSDTSLDLFPFDLEDNFVSVIIQMGISNAVPTMDMEDLFSDAFLHQLFSRVMKIITVEARSRGLD